MKQKVVILKNVALFIVSLLAAILLWPFAVAGIAAYFVAGMKFNRWVASGFALLSVLVWRLPMGEWPLSIGSGSPAYWYVEIVFGVVNWALAAIFVSAFARWPEKLVEGCKSVMGKPA
jgi:hypothetical protein